MASFYVGRRDGGRLLYAGKVQSGFTHDEACAVRERLDPLITGRSPLDEPITKPKATWVTPEVDAEVTYASVNENGLLREPVFKSLRDDLRPAPAPARTRPRPAAARKGVPT
jgi:bifunctional non-homologous end joining protein LigD